MMRRPGKVRIVSDGCVGVLGWLVLMKTGGRDQEECAQLTWLRAWATLSQDDAVKGKCGGRGAARIQNAASIAVTRLLPRSDALRVGIQPAWALLTYVSITTSESPTLLQLLSPDTACCLIVVQSGYRPRCLLAPSTISAAVPPASAAVARLIQTKMATRNRLSPCKRRVPVCRARPYVSRCLL